MLVGCAGRDGARVYAGVKMKDGRFAAMPLMRGGEGDDWVTRMIGNSNAPLGVNARLGAPFFPYIVKGDPTYDILKFDPDRDWAALDGGYRRRRSAARSRSDRTSYVVARITFTMYAKTARRGGR